MRKLYYEDSHLREFTATVTGCTPCPQGWQITLSATAFYPEGGGQACDIGIVGGVQVLQVYECGEDVVHLCDGALEVGSTVTGCIHWERRFDLMQQHTGEHIISGLIHQQFGYHNTGFHVGAEAMEVDFDGPISAEDLVRIEARANEAIWQDLPLRCWIPEPQELEGIFYRTKRALDWPVRIVQIPGYDRCACCGVHVKRTGEVGLIKILSCSKFHQGVRLQMVCGERAYRYMVRIFEENRLVSQAFSAPMEGTGAAAQRMNAALAAEKLRCGSLLEQVFDHIAQRYVNHENVLHFQSGLEPGQVRLLADKLAGSISGWCAVFSENTEGHCYCLATRQGDLRPLCKEMNAALQGRGGGQPNFQQGKVRADRLQIEAFFRTLGQSVTFGSLQ